jgi:hypothetical protein
MSMWRRSWWVIAFCALTTFVYFQALKEKKAAILELAFRLEEMQKEKLMAKVQKEDFQLRLASSNDPAWIEMILMRDLGVVPEGYLKVHFSTEPGSKVGSRAPIQAGT